MAFMAKNRALNSGDASSEAAAQKAQRTLFINEVSLGAPQNRTFEPNLETIEAINSRHRNASVDGGSDTGPTYHANIPYGPLMGVENSL